MVAALAGGLLTRDGPGGQPSRASAEPDQSRGRTPSKPSRRDPTAAPSPRARNFSPGYAVALSYLREATRAPAELNTVGMLVRAAASSQAAAIALLHLPLRTRTDRQLAIVAAAVAIAEELDVEGAA